VSEFKPSGLVWFLTRSQENREEVITMTRSTSLTVVAITKRRASITALRPDENKGIVVDHASHHSMELLGKVLFRVSIAICGPTLL